MSTSVPEVIPPKVTRWANQISKAWTAGVMAILHSAILMGKARADCTDEEYALVIEGVSFGRRMAQMLVRISLDLRLTKHASLLPSDSTTLYYLTRLTDDRFRDLIKNETISPSMKRNEASAQTRKEKKEDAGWVSRAIERSRRRDLLPWTYHREVAGLSTAKLQNNALDWAED